MLKKTRFSLRKTRLQQKDRNRGYKWKRSKWAKGRTFPMQNEWVRSKEWVAIANKSCVLACSPSHSQMVSSLERLRFPDKAGWVQSFSTSSFWSKTFCPITETLSLVLYYPPLMSPGYTPCWAFQHLIWVDNSIKITTPVMSKTLFIGIYLDGGRSGAFNTLCEWQLALLPFLEVFSSIIFMSLLLSLYNAKTEITLS